MDLNQTRGCVCANLRQATRRVTQAYEEVLRPTGLKATQFTLLATVAQTGQLPLTQLADFMGMDRTTLTRNLKPLQEQGLIGNPPGPDRRMRLVDLTKKGLKTLEEALPLWEKAQANMVDKLGPTHYQKLLKLLNQVDS